MDVERIPVIVAAVRIREALEAIGDALAQPQLERLLACDVALEQALAVVPAAADLLPPERTAVLAEIERARDALTRCRRLGATFDELIRLRLEAQGGEYGPRQSMADDYAGRGLNTRA